MSFLPCGIEPSDFGCFIVLGEDEGLVGAFKSAAAALARAPEAGWILFAGEVPLYFAVDRTWVPCGDAFSGTAPGPGSEVPS